MQQRNYFTALLKSPDGKLLSEGYACGNARGKYVEFESDFVPIMSFGEKAQIVRVVNDTETHVFSGTVYLCSPELMRIVNVDGELLTQLELSEKMQELSLEAKVSPVMYKNGLLQFAAEKLIKFDARIFAISLSQLKFVSSEPFAEGERLTLSITQPISVSGMEVEITQNLLFGEGQSGYRCNITLLPEPGYSVLAQYLEQNSCINDDEDDDYI
ncbi:MAG: hypothetical protein IKV41_06150 [Oscillospiraceae bacterium]|nr:hypothetical protein [Oscillospiraceae bacterium]